MRTILADENIPFVTEAFGHLGHVETISGRQFSPALVKEAEVLLVRSVTPIHETLLAGSQVRFVGSATIGIDHVDTAYLAAQNIAFAHAPGSNATSVVEYVLAALFLLGQQRGEEVLTKTVGIIGCGHVGEQLARRLAALGIQVLRHDPPRARQEGGKTTFTDLQTLLQTADIVSAHVPLTHAGPDATHHLLNEETLAWLRPSAWLLNTARGAVVSNAALRHRLQTAWLGAALLDVWENEPTPDLDLLAAVDLATPHIAGYSFDGKVQGTIQLYDALTRFLGVMPQWDPKEVLRLTPEDRPALVSPNFDNPTTALHHLTEQMYDLVADDTRMRGLLRHPPEEQAAYFTRLRKTYPRRRTFGCHVLPSAAVPAGWHSRLTEGLGITLAGTAG